MDAITNSAARKRLVETMERVCDNHEPIIVTRRNALVRDCQRSPFEGLGKLEALRFDLAGKWSRRITAEHRLVYMVEEERLGILPCRYHD